MAGVLRRRWYLCAKIHSQKGRDFDIQITSDIAEINGKIGTVVVANAWPGKRNKTDYRLGNSWFTDKQRKDYYFGKIQGGKTVSKWKDAILSDWAGRWTWLAGNE